MRKQICSTLAIAALVIATNANAANAASRTVETDLACECLDGRSFPTVPASVPEAQRGNWCVGLCMAPSCTAAGCVRTKMEVQHAPPPVFPGTTSGSGGDSATGSGGNLPGWAIASMVIGALLLAFLLWRLWRLTHPHAPTVPAPIPPGTTTPVTTTTTPPVDYLRLERLRAAYHAARENWAHEWRLNRYSRGTQWAAGFMIRQYGAYAGYARSVGATVDLLPDVLPRTSEDDQLREFPDVLPAVPPPPAGATYAVAMLAVAGTPPIAATPTTTPATPTPGVPSGTTPPATPATAGPTATPAPASTGATPLQIVATGLPPGIQGQPYRLQLRGQAIGGLLPYSWDIDTNDTTCWLSIDHATGELTGTPNGTGTATFTVELEDRSGTIIRQPLTVYVAPPVVTPLVPPPAPAPAPAPAAPPAGGGAARPSRGAPAPTGGARSP